MPSLSESVLSFSRRGLCFYRSPFAVEPVHIPIEPILVELAEILFQNILQRPAPYPVAHRQFIAGFDQSIECHDLGQDPRFTPEAGSSENLVNPSRCQIWWPTCTAPACRNFFDLNLIPIDVAAALVLLWTPGSHLRLQERDMFLWGIVQ